jgi:uncharacterized membrane protein
MWDCIHMLVGVDELVNVPNPQVSPRKPRNKFGHPISVWSLRVALIVYAVSRLGVIIGGCEGSVVHKLIALSRYLISFRRSSIAA